VRGDNSPPDGDAGIDVERIKDAADVSGHGTDESE